jgi:hypothetical protein
MRRFWLITTVCCFVAIVLGCGGIGGFVRHERLVGDIGLHATDTKEQTAVIVFDGGPCLVPATVFAVGWDESHLIAMRYPPSPTGLPDKGRIEYYIVVVRDRKAYRPFDRTEFAIHCDLLGVSPHLDFTLQDLL